MPVTPAAAYAIDALRAQSDAVTANLLTLIETLWHSAPDLRDQFAAGFVVTTGPVLEGAQAVQAQLADAYLATVMSILTGEAVPADGVAAEIATTEALRGITTEQLLQRPFNQTYYALSEGSTFPDAAAQGLARAASIIRTNMQLAKTHAARDILRRKDKAGVVGYRRVPRGGSSCALCVLASTQRYHVADLMPIHPGCDCAVLPIVGHHDPGQVIDPDQLDAVHATLKAYTGSARLDPDQLHEYVVVTEHGEWGPTLAVSPRAKGSPEATHVDTTGRPTQ